MSKENLSPRISVLCDQDLALIEEEYRQKKLKETLLGPSVSTMAHMFLLICAAVFLKGAMTPAEPEFAVVTQIEKALRRKTWRRRIPKRRVFPSPRRWP
jgi:hypothetical protein